MDQLLFLGILAVMVLTAYGLSGKWWPTVRRWLTTTAPTPAPSSPPTNVPPTASVTMTELDVWGQTLRAETSAVKADVVQQLEDLRQWTEEALAKIQNELGEMSYAPLPTIEPIEPEEVTATPSAPAEEEEQSNPVEQFFETTESGGNQPAEEKGGAE